MAQHSVLHNLHPAVRRAEEVGLENLIRLHYIGQVVPAPPAQPAYVIIGMIAYAVSSGLHLSQQMGILLCIVAHHKEGGLGTEALQCVEYERSGFGNGAVIKGKIDGLFPLVHPPKGVGVYPSEEYRRLLNDHSSSSPASSAACTAMLVSSLPGCPNMPAPP